MTLPTQTSFSPHQGTYKEHLKGGNSQSWVCLHPLGGDHILPNKPQCYVSVREQSVHSRGPRGSAKSLHPLWRLTVHPPEGEGT